MAKIVRFHRIGGPEVLNIEEVPSRESGKGEPKLRVQAIGLNRSDSMFMHGYYLEPTQLPATLGYEAAGVVVGVGAGVDRGWLNKKVSTIPTFSLNQYGVIGNEVIVPVQALAEYPEHLKPTEATSIWMQYMTAYGALIEIGRLKKGEFVLITAASSSAGLAPFDTRKFGGAIPIATTRKSDKRSGLLASGAEHVIATDEEDLVSRVREITNGAGARIIFDPIGGSLVDQLPGKAAPCAATLPYGWVSRGPKPVPLVLPRPKGLTHH